MPQLNFAHPSVTSLKILPPVITYSNTGLLESNRPIRVLIKNTSAQNGSTPTRDVAVRGTYVARSIQDINRSNTLYSNLPHIAQTSSNCQSIPLLHSIQSQLNFPMNYDALWDCLEPNPRVDSVYQNILSLLGDEVATSYLKLFDLLFSGKCFSIKENICPDESEIQRVGNQNDGKNDCDNPCYTKIKITAVEEPAFNTEQELRDRINLLGPKSISADSETVRKLIVLQQKPEWTWDMVKNMPPEVLNIYAGEKLSDWLGSHAVTITGYSNGKFHIQNSWGTNHKNISMSFSDLQQYFRLTQPPYLQVLGLYTQYFPVVEICSTPTTSELQKCREDLCKEKGYDGLKPTSNPNECDCYCEEVTISANNCKNSGQKIQKVFSIDQKKCVCPDHPNPEKYVYVNSLDCCELPIPGSWCEKKYCEQTKTFYQTGVEKRGTADEYDALEAQGLAARWINSTRPDTGPCVRDEIPPICSGFATYNSLQINVDKHNIVHISEIKLI